MSEFIPYIKILPQDFYLTALSANTPASIAYDIRKEYAEHPVTGLHKAELYIYGTSQAIRLAIDNIASDKRKIDAWIRDLNRLKRYQRYRLGWLYHLLVRKYLDLEILDLEAKIQSAQMAIAEAVPMLEDAQAELTAAMAERTKVLEALPFTPVSKAQLSEICDGERLVAKLNRISAAENARVGMISPAATLELQSELCPNVSDDRRSHP